MGDTASPQNTPRRLDPRAYGARPRPQGRLPRVLWAPSDAPAGPQASHQLNPALRLFQNSCQSATGHRDRVDNLFALCRNCKIWSCDLDL